MTQLYRPQQYVRAPSRLAVASTPGDDADVEKAIAAMKASMLGFRAASLKESIVESTGVAARRVLDTDYDNSSVASNQDIEMWLI